MDEKTDGRTAMERLARELMENVNSYSWCREHIPSVIEDIGDWETWDYGKAIAAVRSDIERRIAEADLSDDKARDRALVDWRERIAELEALCRALNAESADEAVAVARTMAEEHYELKELREAGRVMPEGVSWPRLGDGGPVRLGGEAWTREGERVRVVAVTHKGKAAVRPWGRTDGRGARWVPLASLLGERPDSWEMLREDSLKRFVDYWGCRGSSCADCPATVDGRSPRERIDGAAVRTYCDAAMQLDLVARAERLAGVQGE